MRKPLRVGYLVNRYPAVSHSFIRREIAALELDGVSVKRFSIREADPDLPDPLDKAELARTKILFTGSIWNMIFCFLWLIATRPIRLLNVFPILLDNALSFSKEPIRRMAYLAEASQMLRELRITPVDHVHAHFGTNPAFVALLVFRLGGPPYSFTAHGPDEFDRPVELNLATKIANARFTVAISEFGRSQLMRWSDPQRWNSIRVIRCGLDESFLQAVPRPASEAPILCCVARLSGQKGLPVLIEAAALVKKRGIPFKLILVGDGELRRSIEHAITRYALQEEVEILGWKSSSDVRRQIVASRALVMSSFAEGLPVVIMESFSLGRPVIATRIAGIPELVDEGCGWVVAPGSAAELAEAMVKALTSPIAIIDKLGLEGRRRVNLYHDARANALNLKSLIEKANE